MKAQPYGVFLNQLYIYNIQGLFNIIHTCSVQIPLTESTSFVFCDISMILLQTYRTTDSFPLLLNS